MQAGLSFSHFGFYVQDIDRMERFYTELLGFFVTDRGTLAGPTGEFKLVFLSRDPDEHHQIVLATGRPEALAFNLINQISLRADSLGTLKNLYAKLAQAGAGDIQPITHGNARQSAGTIHRHTVVCEPAYAGTHRFQSARR